MKKFVMILSLCLVSAPAFADWDLDDGGEIGVEASLSSEEIHTLHESSEEVSAAAAALLLMKFDCQEYSFDPKSPGVTGALLDLSGVVINSKSLILKKKNDDQIEMTIDNLLKSIFIKQGAEVSLCNLKKEDYYRCESKKSEFVSFLRRGEAKGQDLLLIERTLADKKGIQSYPLSKSDSSRRLKALIVCKESRLN